MSENVTYPSGLGTIFPDDEKQLPIQAYFTPPTKKKYNLNWIVLWQNPSEIGVGLMEQAEAENMTLSDYRVRDFLLGTIGIGNYVFVNQREVSRRLNLNKSTVNESIKRLIKLGILLIGPKSGRSNTYMINPAFCFAGGLNQGIQERNRIIKDSKAKIHKFSESNE